jgi:hypothetical protein
MSISDPVGVSFATLHLPRPGRAPAFDASKLNAADLHRERDRCIARVDSKNPPITRVLPVPRAIPLGGQLHVATELRMVDLARLQRWLEEQVPHPLASIPPGWADPEPETRLARLAVAWEAAASWPVRYGTTAGAILLGSDGGRAYFLSLVLRPANPDLGPVECLDLLPSITPIEWAGLRRVAYGLTPREEIADELAPEPGGGGRTANWCLSLHRASQFVGGPGYLDIDRWYVSQWRNWCNEGKASEFTPEFGLQAKRVAKRLEGANDGH